ncbi:MAG: hypothetical protein ACE5EC_06560 [Phycisphaerae bacterium]
MESAEQRTYDAQSAIESFQEAARLNHSEPFRTGCTLRLPGYGQCVMTGDLHGHLKNLEKLRTYAMLAKAHSRHVVLHEMIHADLKAPGDMDGSHELLLRAAEYKQAFPEQVHFLQSNHELAQLTGYMIAKNGRLVIEDYIDAVAQAYGTAHTETVLSAMSAFIASFPAAIRTENRIWLSHSLPNVDAMDEFHAEVFEQDLTREQIEADRSIFQLVWGRRYTREHIDSLAELFDVDLFICGHQPQDTGYDVVHDRLIILASDHNHGVFLPFDLSKRQTVDGLVGSIRKFVEVV